MPGDAEPETIIPALGGGAASPPTAIVGPAPAIAGSAVLCLLCCGTTPVATLGVGAVCPELPSPVAVAVCPEFPSPVVVCSEACASPDVEPPPSFELRATDVGLLHAAIVAASSTEPAAAQVTDDQSRTTHPITSRDHSLFCFSQANRGSLRASWRLLSTSSQTYRAKRLRDVLSDMSLRSGQNALDIAISRGLR